MQDIKKVIRWFENRNVPMPGAKAMNDAAVHYMKQYVRLSAEDPCSECKHLKTAMEKCFHDGDLGNCRKCEDRNCKCKDCDFDNNWELKDGE